MSYDRSFVLAHSTIATLPADFYDITNVRSQVAQKIQKYELFALAFYFWRKVYLYKARVKPLSKAEIDGVNPRFKYSEPMPNAKALSDTSL